MHEKYKCLSVTHLVTQGTHLTSQGDWLLHSRMHKVSATQSGVERGAILRQTDRQASPPHTCPQIHKCGRVRVYAAGRTVLPTMSNIPSLMRHCTAGSSTIVAACCSAVPTDLTSIHFPTSAATHAQGTRRSAPRHILAVEAASLIKLQT